MTDRLVKRVSQGFDEVITYSIVTTAWGSSPSNVEVKVYDVTDVERIDVSSTVLSGSASINEDTITLPSIGSLTVNKRYRAEIKFTSEGNIYKPYIEIFSEY